MQGRVDLIRGKQIGKRLGHTDQKRPKLIKAQNLYFSSILL